MRLVAQTVALLLSAATLISAMPVDKVKYIPYPLHVSSYQCHLELMKISVTRFSNERNSILSQTLAVSRLKTREKSCILCQTWVVSKLKTREKNCILSLTWVVSRLKTSARNYTRLLILDVSKLRINKWSSLHVRTGVPRVG